MRKLIAIGLATVLYAIPSFASADQTVTVAVPDRGAWDSTFTEFGLQQGLFKKEGLDVHIMYVKDEAALESALSSGKADIAVAASFTDILGAWHKGAPIKVISPESTGAPDIFWYARVVGAVAKMSDLHGQPVGYAGPGTASYFILRALLKGAGVDDATLVTTFSAEAGYPDVLSAQLEASWSKPPANVKYLIAGEIRLVARGNDAPEIRNETFRVNVANANFLASHRSAVAGFLKAYNNTIDWAYSDPRALTDYAKLSDQSLDAAKYVFKEFTSKEAVQTDQIEGEDRVLAQALEAKRIPTALTAKDISGIYDLVLKHP